jgi:hypothetical protein
MYSFEYWASLSFPTAAIHFERKSANLDVSDAVVAFSQQQSTILLVKASKVGKKGAQLYQNQSTDIKAIPIAIAAFLIGAITSSVGHS